MNKENRMIIFILAILLMVSLALNRKYLYPTGQFCTNNNVVRELCYHIYLKGAIDAYNRVLQDVYIQDVYIQDVYIQDGRDSVLCYDSLKVLYHAKYDTLIARYVR